MTIDQIHQLLVDYITEHSVYVQFLESNYEQYGSIILPNKKDKKDEGLSGEEARYDGDVGDE
jgi:hypothetical protein